MSVGESIIFLSVSRPSTLPSITLAPVVRDRLVQVRHPQHDLRNRLGDGHPLPLDEFPGVAGGILDKRDHGLTALDGPWFPRHLAARGARFFHDGSHVVHGQAKVAEAGADVVGVDA